MTKRSITIVAVVFLAVIIMFSAKVIISRGKDVPKNIKELTLEEQYSRISNSVKPSIIIFSYDADCCENTKKFFNEYNSNAKKLMKDYENKFETLFINTGIIESDKGNKVLERITKDNEVSKLPSILVRDSKGKKIKVFEGTFDDKEIRKVLDGVMKQ
ncbi:hypothetical protein [Clostridium manihotivorum]|uniref:Thioredoxin domain-containing protein n=1 Tax=Clostridium manihotivorum TaxID=2320868 RepID=A0A3R5TGA2_9CLOT|nr:hypothetical protein [Clostridium manihotivorum]QAA32783.1 hypothetical protein C1I91_14675 [Clostridium manihotivorum]